MSDDDKKCGEECAKATGDGNGRRVCDDCKRYRRAVDQMRTAEDERKRRRKEASRLRRVTDPLCPIRHKAHYYRARLRKLEDALEHHSTLEPSLQIGLGGQTIADMCSKLSIKIDKVTKLLKVCDKQLNTPKKTGKRADTDSKA